MTRLSLVVDPMAMHYRRWPRHCGHNAPQKPSPAMNAWQVQTDLETLRQLWESDGDVDKLAFNADFFKKYIKQKSATYQIALETGLATDVRNALKSQKQYERFAGFRRNVWEFGSGSIYEEYRQIGANMQFFKAAGRSLSEPDVIAALKGVSARFQKDYFDIELQTVEGAAIMARKWEAITASGKNLRYRTAGDSKVRADHRKLDGLVFPVDHPFWDKHYPPSDYGCRCDVEETNEDTYTGQVPNVPVNPALSGNPGKSGVVFTDKHSYLKLDGLRQEAFDSKSNLLTKFAPTLLQKKIRDEVKAFAKQELRGSHLLQIGDRSVSAFISRESINEFVQYDEVDNPLRLELIYDFKNLIKTAEYKGLGYVDKTKSNKKFVKNFHLFKINKHGQEFKLSVEEREDNKFRIYAITRFRE